MLIFVMSFKNDAHIIDMLMEYAENNEKNCRKIYITHLESDEHPKKQIANIIERELKPYYENDKRLRPKCEIRKNLLLEHTIKEIKIAKSFDAKKGGLVWRNVE